MHLSRILGDLGEGGEGQKQESNSMAQMMRAIADIVHSLLITRCKYQYWYVDPARDGPCWPSGKSEKQPR